MNTYKVVWQEVAACEGYVQAESEEQARAMIQDGTYDESQFTRDKYTIDMVFVNESEV